VTAICGGASSAAKQGFAQTIFIAPAVIGAALNNIPTPQAMLIAGAVGALTFEMSQFCTNDPPALPTITADDVFALLNPINVVGFISARQKFEDLIRNYLWPQLCDCASGPQPSVPSAPTAVTNFDATPPVTGAVTTVGCADIERAVDLSQLTVNHPTPGHTGDIIDLGHLLGLVAGPQQTSATYTLPLLTFYLPGGVTQYQIIVTSLANAPGVANSDLSLTFFNSGGTILGGNSYNVPNNGVTQTSAITNLPTGASYFRWEWSGTPHAPPNIDFTIRFFCNNQTTGTVTQPCCPPDPTMQAAINQILGYVTLIQRQAAPFAYIAGASHSISGSGELSVQGLLGAKVVLGALPGSVGVESGDPAELWEVGWINWGNPDGFSARSWINCSPFISLPAVAGQYTRIGYSLKPGVTATLTELIREP
jgi:hypothetical protein